MAMMMRLLEGQLRGTFVPGVVMTGIKTAKTVLIPAIRGSREILRCHHQR
jgi:hypothetical protein